MTVLPDHVKKIVAEIETEIGEEPGDAEAPIRRHAARSCRQRPGRGGGPRDPHGDRRGSRSAGPGRDAGPGPPDVHRADRRLPRRPGPADQRRHLRRRLLGDGGRQGHPVLLAVRAPPAAVLRHGGGGLHPARPGRRAVEDPADRRDVRPPAAGPGADDPADRRLPAGPARAAGRGRRARGDPPVRGDARRAQARHDHDHERRARPVPLARQDPRSSWPTSSVALRGSEDRPGTLGAD